MMPSALEQSSALLLKEALLEKKVRAEQYPELPVVLGPTGPTITGEVIGDAFGLRAVVLHNVLSPEECAALIDIAEGRHVPADQQQRRATPPPPPQDATAVAGGDQEEHRPPEWKGMVQTATNLQYRNNMSVTVLGVETGRIIFERVHGALAKLLGSDHQSVTEETRSQFLYNGVGMEGRWTMYGLNPGFRLARYNPDGHFGPHCDADFVSDVHHRSLKTFMLYLNDSYAHGETNFLAEQEIYFSDVTQRYCARPEGILASLKAKTGDAVVFDHNILHEGATVVGGYKYIMRSELMYAREHDANGGPLTEEQKREAELEERAMGLYTEACRLEAENRRDEAVRLYRAAFKLCPALERRA